MMIDTPAANPDSPPRDDPRSDIEQAVEARSDAVARGDGGTPAPDDPSTAVGGAGGEVKNQNEDAQ